MRLFFVPEFFLGKVQPRDQFRLPPDALADSPDVGLNPRRCPARLRAAVAKIRVKLGAAEAEVEADPEHLKETIELVPLLAAKLPESSAQRVSPQSSRQDVKEADGPARASLAQLPTVALEKSDSLADVIGKFFADPWGRERRKLSDVREALQSYGMNYPKQSVAVALLRLAKAGRLRRFKAEDGEFVYTASSPGLFAPLAARTELEVEEAAESSPNSLGEASA